MLQGSAVGKAYLLVGHTVALTEVQLFEQAAATKVILRCVICHYDAYSVVVQSPLEIETDFQIHIHGVMIQECMMV